MDAFDPQTTPTCNGAKWPACFLVTENVDVLRFFQESLPQTLVLVPLRGGYQEVATQLAAFAEKYEGPVFLDTDSTSAQETTGIAALWPLPLPILFFGSRTSAFEQKLGQGETA